MYKKGNKILASLIVFIMLLANLGNAGVQIGQVIAADLELNKQDIKTNNDNVTFNSYFMDEKNPTREATKKIGEDNSVIAEISVKDSGYLKDARIDFVDSNFLVSETTSENIAKVEKNQVILNQVNAGSSIKVELPIKFEKNAKTYADQFNKISKAQFTAVYVDGNGTTHNITKDINLCLKWTANVETTLTGEITKYIPYTIGNKTGLIMQMLVKENVKNNVLPVKENNIEIKSIEINGVKPSSVTVYSKENIEYNLDNKTQNLVIKYKNEPNEQNEIKWNDEALREYVVTYIYPQTAISEETTVNIQINSNTKVYSFDEQEVKANFNNQVVLKEKVGDIVDFKTYSTDMISKGYMFANYDREEKLETNFSQRVITNISLAELVDNITIKMQSDNFINETQIGTANSYYKNVKISKSKMQEFFGEDGIISIYNSQGLIKVIDKTIEEENIVIEVNSDEITLVTSKPLKEGEFTLDFDKAIRADVIYSQEQLSSFTNLKSAVTVQANNYQTVITDKTVESSTYLIDTLLQADLYMNNTNLSTVVKNENVEFRAVLKTSSEYNKLFKNPIVVINLPEYVESINVKSIQVLFDEEIKVKACNIVGKQIIVEFEGIQTNYNIGSVYGGTNIVITTDLTTNILTPNKTDIVTMAVISNEEQIQSNIDINFVAPSGVVAVNKLSNYAVGKEIMALTKDEKDTIEVDTTAKVATEEIQVINNYNNKIENIVILGRTLATDTTNPLTNAPLENNLNVPMLGAINTNGLENVTVYYSTNGSATRELTNAQNGWTTEVQDFSTVKSYLIVLNNNIMNVGDSLKFSYDMQIPENLKYSLKTSGLYTVFFDNVQEMQTLIGDNVTSPVAGLTTGEAPNLEVILSSDIPENSAVGEGQYIRYTAKIKNTSTFDAENVKLSVDAPSVDGKYETNHVEYKEDDYNSGYFPLKDKQNPLIKRTFTIGTIKAGEEIEQEFILYVYSVERSEDVNEGTPLEVTTSVIADKMQKAIDTKYTLVVKNLDLNLYVTNNKSATSIVTKGDEIQYTAKVSKIGNNDLRNVVVKAQIPTGLIIKEADIDGDNSQNIVIDDSKNTVEFRISNVEIETDVECNVKVEVGNVEGEIKPIFTAVANNTTYYGNVVKNTVEKLNLSITQYKLDNPYVKEEDKITFAYLITNNSNINCNNLTLENIITSGMDKNVSVEVIYDTISSSIQKEIIDNKITVDKILLYAGDSVIVKITTTASRLNTGETQKTVTNYAKISTTGMDTIESNRVTAFVEYNSLLYRTDETGNVVDDTTNPIVKNIISGIAWLDKNQDGERNDNEELLGEIEVRLLNKQTNEVIAKTKTLSNGEYSFTGLDKGEYLVVALYDSYKYELTEYQKPAVSQSTNSDFIDVKMDIDGTERQVAISDTIRIINSNARNIDLGLLNSFKSDLKLDKYVSAITVSYGNSVNTYNYTNSKLAKVEIPAKNLSDAAVIIEYKIVVTNEGAISNYVKKIVDYIPSGMKFNSELNKDWYQSTNGDIYNSSLANELLKSGESKEVTLTLTRQMTDDNTGIVNNNAELYEVYNEEGTLDKDSTPANKVNSEDDMSSADVVISVKTGDAVMYTLIISVVILIGLAISIYYVRRLIIKKM